jgi:hypothetical protein
MLAPWQHGTLENSLLDLSEPRKHLGWDLLAGFYFSIGFCFVHIVAYCGTGFQTA